MPRLNALPRLPRRSSARASVGRLVPPALLLAALLACGSPKPPRVALPAPYEVVPLHAAEAVVQPVDADGAVTVELPATRTPEALLRDLAGELEAQGWQIDRTMPLPRGAMAMTVAREGTELRLLAAKAGDKVHLLLDER
jgi:hypothetical protein